MTDQREIASNDLFGSIPNLDSATVIDFVLKRGMFGSGYWVRRATLGGRPITSADRQTIKQQVACGNDLTQLSSPPVPGSGQLREIQKVEPSVNSQPVAMTNWPEGATAFATEFAKWLGPRLMALGKAAANGDNNGPQAVADQISPSESTASDQVKPLTAFQTGELIFYPDRVTLCSVTICCGSRSQARRQLLDLFTPRHVDGTVRAFSADEISQMMELKNGAKSVPGLIRDLRDDIVSSLE